MSEIAATDAAAQGRAVIDALAARPGGRLLLELAGERHDLALVGGAVRDLLLGRAPRELDVTVAEGAAALAREIAAALPGGETHPARAEVHERFGTAVVAWPGGRIDIAERRAESYAQPGALPDVRPGSVEEDLARRDFTVNAIAVTLAGADAGTLRAAEHALADLSQGRLRVLHERSFRDDPTRLLRLGRYVARLGFAVERATTRLAAEAVAGGALGTVSEARIGAELWLAGAESAPERAFAALGELGVLQALSLPAPFDEALWRAARALLPADGDPAALAIAVLLFPRHAGGREARREAAELMVRLEFLAGARERVLAGAFDAAGLAADIERAQRPSQLRALLASRPVEAVAIAGALAAKRSPEAAERARRWLDELRAVRLEIGGSDLLAAGLAEGPEIGRRLQRVLDMRLDGELPGGREAELRAALAPEPAP